MNARLEERFVLVEGVSSDTPERKFMIYVPSSLVGGEATTSGPVSWTSRIPDAAAYSWRADPAYGLSIGLADMPFEFDPADWGVLEMEKSGAIVVGMTSGPDADGRDVEIHGRWTREGREGVLVARVFQEGRRFYQIAGSAPLDVEDEARANLLLAVRSFCATAPRDVDDAPNLPLDVPGTSGLSFDLPFAWRVEIRDDASLTLTWSDEPDRLGRLTIRSLMDGGSRDGYAVLRAFADELIADGSHVNGAAVIPLFAPPPFLEGAATHLVARRGVEVFDCPAFTYRNANQGVLVSLRSPTRGRSAEAWAINKRGFEVVRTTLRHSLA